MPLRLVLDTNVWLDWLVFHDPGIASIKAAVDTGRVEIFVDPACSLELERALTYTLQKRVLDADAQSACLAECRRFASTIEGGRIKDGKSPLPTCRDPDDQKFLELARDSGADFLITKDHALLELARRKLCPAPFCIVTPQQFTDAVKADIPISEPRSGFQTADARR